MSKQKKEATRANAEKAAARGNRAQGRRKPPGSSRNAPSSGGGSRRILLIALVVVLVLAVAGGAYALLGGDSDAEAAYNDLVAAGTCTEKSFPETGTNQHTTSLDEKVKYDSDPATHGKHYQTPALWGMYDAPVQQEQLVHNLEHGAIVVQYGDKVPQGQVEALREAVRSDRDFMVVAPYPKLGDKVALTAWGHLVECTGFQPEALDVAKARWRNKGPESPIDPTAGRLPNW